MNGLAAEFIFGNLSTTLLTARDDDYWTYKFTVWLDLVPT
jgi:hypothetical protein